MGNVFGKHRQEDRDSSGAPDLEAATRLSRESSKERDELSLSRGIVEMDELNPWRRRRNRHYDTEELLVKSITHYLDKGGIPTDRELRHSIHRLGRKHDIIDKMCKAVSAHILRLCKEIKTMTASYEESKENEVVFVIRHEGNIDNIKRVTSNYQVYLREVDCVSKEAERVSYRHNYADDMFSKDEDMVMTQVISKHSTKLFNDHSNLNYVSASRVQSVGFKRNVENLTLFKGTCIVMYVSIKGMIPLQEDPLPTMLDGYPTDVMEGEFSLYHKSASDYHEEVKTGCAIMCQNTGLVGTIGPFVKLEEKVCFLTCSHIVCMKDDMEKIKKLGGRYKLNKKEAIPIYQPHCNVERGEVGKVTHLIFTEGGTAGKPGIDVAVVEITHRHPTSGTFPDCTGYMYEEIGYQSQAELFYSGKTCVGPEVIEPGLQVVMFGSQSGLTRGIVRTMATAIRKKDCVLHGTPYTLYNQIEILEIRNSSDTPFAKEGDSGALVFFKKGSHPLIALGVLVGGTPSRQYMATPIWEIYKILKCSPLTFDNEYMETD